MNVRGYHIHVYCTPEERPLAMEIRAALLRDLPVIKGAGSVREGPVGPHTRAH